MRKLLPLASVVLLAGCPSDLINGMTKLDPKVLAVTTSSAAGNPSYSVRIRWNDVLNAKAFQIIKKVDGTTTTLRPEKSDAKEYIDTDVAAGKQYSYTVRAMDGGNTQLTISDESAVELLAPMVGKPGVSPNVAVIDNGRPQVSWTAAEGATWYFVRVYGTDGKEAYGGYANAIPWQVGGPSYQSNISLPGYSELTGTSLENGKNYFWRVSAIRANKEKLEEATAVDIRVSDEGKLSFF